MKVYKLLDRAMSMPEKPSRIYVIRHGNAEKKHSAEFQETIDLLSEFIAQKEQGSHVGIFASPHDNGFQTGLEIADHIQKKYPLLDLSLPEKLFEHDSTYGNHCAKKVFPHFALCEHDLQQDNFSSGKEVLEALPQLNKFQQSLEIQLRKGTLTQESYAKEIWKKLNGLINCPPDSERIRDIVTHARINEAFDALVFVTHLELVYKSLQLLRFPQDPPIQLGEISIAHLEGFLLEYNTKMFYKIGVKKTYGICTA